MIVRCLSFLLFFSFSLFAEGDLVRVYILDKVKSASPGSVVSIPIQVTSYSPRSLVLVNHLKLPGGFLPLVSNDVLMHLHPHQSYQQTLYVKIPENAPEGKFKFSFQVLSETNVNLFYQDEGSIIVERPPEQIPLLEDPSNLTITSENAIEAAPDEMLYISAVIKNSQDYPWNCNFKLNVPKGWQTALFENESIHLEPGESSLQIACVKVPANALAEEYSIWTEVNGDYSAKEEIKVRILQHFEFSARVDLKEDSCDLVCENDSNAPLRIYIRAITDPICLVEFSQESILIPPFDSIRVPFAIDPSNAQDEQKQFILFKLFKEESLEPFYQVPFSFDLMLESYSEDDPFVRIPSHFRTFVLGENHDTVGVVEIAGRGVFDSEKCRTIDYCIRVPTDSRNVIYSVDQRLYLGLTDPNWDLNLGDTVYALSPLTQSYRYGRGGGFDAGSGGLSCGAHYTQNTFSNDYNPREACAFVEYAPIEEFSLGCNYLHKVLTGIPTSNIVTFESEFEFFPNIWMELEAGDNLLEKSTDHDTHAYRFETRGRVRGDTWFDVEKIYAGTDFFGYYQAMNLFSSTLDMPLTEPLRANFNYTSLRQNYGSLDPNDAQTLSPRQKQAEATFSYNFSNGATFSLNGLFLKAKEVGICEDYNFYQKWGGANFLLVQNGYIFNSNFSLGQQKDYLTSKTSHCLQRYYNYLGKELSNEFFASCFYEGGHIDYFDVNPWRTAFGASLRYRYQNGCWCDLFLQKVNHRHDDYQLSQLTFNLHHEFSNRHAVDVSLQRFIYKKHYPSDSFFLVSYTIPFGLPFGEKGDRGSLSGSVFDMWNNCPIPNALVNLNGKQVRTDAEGRFSFQRAPVGSQSIKADLLPGNLMAVNGRSCPIDIKKGKNNELLIPCIPSVSIEGNILLFGFLDDNPFQEDVSLIEIGGLQGIRVSIDLDHGKEIYTCLTDKRGKFRFPRLSPGSWHVYINPDSLPNLHSLNMNDFILEMDPGEEKSVSIKVLPEKRVMQRL